MSIGKIPTWANSRGLRLSPELPAQPAIEVGDDVEVVATEQRVVVRRWRRPKDDLADLVAKIPESYQPDEFATKSPVGREAW
jgi:antitoxin MazE